MALQKNQKYLVLKNYLKQENALTSVAPKL